MEPANDNDPNVQIEIVAAEQLARCVVGLGDDSDVWADDESISTCSWLRDLNESYWPWDPSRPVAGQYEEYLAERDQSIVDGILAEQSRHDVAASVARHADLPGPAAELLASVPELTPEQLDAGQCPEEVAVAIERIADVVDAPGVDPADGDP